jgi:Tsp45I type II restriction enzyme
MRSGKGWKRRLRRATIRRLLATLLSLDLFPIKDSYVAYLKRGRGAIDRNPATVARLCGRLHEMGIAEIYRRCSEPKETNRQLGPLFRRWLRSGALGIAPIKAAAFVASGANAILDAGDGEMERFARERLNYTRTRRASISLPASTAST